MTIQNKDLLKTLGIIALIAGGIILAILFGDTYIKSPSSNTEKQTTIDTSDTISITYQNISPQQLKEMLKSKDFLLIDVRILNQPHIPGTDAFIPYNQIDKIIQYIGPDKDRKVVLYCRSGTTSSYVARELVKRGYKNVYNLEGGMNAWKRLGD